jgi:hypothetical protein
MNVDGVSAEQMKVLQKALALVDFNELPECQSRYLIEHLITIVATRLTKDKSDYETFTEVVYSTILWFKKLREILNPLSDEQLDNKKRDIYLNGLKNHRKETDHRTWIWYCRNPNFAFLHGKESKDDFWPIDEAELTECCEDYAKNHWAHSPTIDIILTESLLYARAFNYGCSIKCMASNFYLGPKIKATPEAFLDHIFSHDEIKKQGFDEISRKIELRKVLTSLAFGIFQTLTSIFIGIDISGIYGSSCGVLAGLAMYSLIDLQYHNKVSNIGQEKAKKIEHAIEKYNSIVAVHDIIKKRLSPSFLREQLSATTKTGITWPVAIFPIVDRAIRRHPDIWV